MSSRVSAIFLRFCLILFISLICLFLFLRSSFFDVQQVIVTGNQTISAETLLELAEIEKGINIFLMDFNNTVLMVESHPLVKHVEPIRRLPNTLELVVTEREAWALISANEGMIVIDQEGVFLYQLDYLFKPEMPLITLNEIPPLVIGQAVNQTAAASVYKIITALDTATIESISEYHCNVDTDEVTLYTLRGTAIRFGSSKERFNQKIPMVKQALKLEQELALAGEGKLNYLDIRYEGPPVIQTN